MKVMTFSQQGSRAICILSATGTISSVTLRQPTSSGGTLTYEVLVSILSQQYNFYLLPAVFLCLDDRNRGEQNRKEIRQLSYE